MARSSETRIVLCAIVALGFPVLANGALIDRGGGLIYDADRNITWLQNANHGAGSAQDDGFSNTDGLMTWQSAVAWAANLSYYDSVRDVTYTDWRLPTTVQPDPTCSQQEGGGAFSAGANCTGSEMGHLFYQELGGTSFASILTSNDPDLNLFTNVQGDGYWSENFDANFAWVFNHGYGLQGPDNKTLGYYAWAVRDGDVASAVPLPAALWLLATGLVGLAGRSLRRAAPGYTPAA